MTIQDKIQSQIQKTKEARQRQQAASSSAAKTWSTSTPTVTTTPTVASTPKAVASTQQTAITPISQTISNIKQSTSTQTPQINLFASQRPTAQTATQDLLSRKEETKEVKNTTIPTNVVKTALNIWWTVAETVTKTLYNQWMDYINTKIWQVKDTVSTVKTTAKATKTALDLFNPVEEYRKQKWLTLNQLWQDVKTEWDSWEWIWMVRDTIANTIEWLPRWITRAEYWIAELIDWWVDAEWATKLKNSIESDLDYWENTRVYKRVKEAESFKDVLKNPLMYAGWTLWEMLPMFISAWVAIPTTFAQVYWETYRDYASDESLQAAWLTDNQIRLMSLWVAWVNTLIELWSDLVEWIMPWTRTAVKWAEKEVRRTLTKPFMNIFKNVVKWWVSEWMEEVLQNEIQDQVASYNGSDRDLPTWTDRLTTFWISAVIWWILQWWNIMVEINEHKELKQAFDEWSEAVDDIAPWVSQEEKEKLFSAIVAAEIQDANMSDKQVTKYENESAALYNEKAKLTEELNTTTDKTKQQEINRKIEDIDARIKNIDEIINRWQAVMEEVNKKLEELSQKQEIPAQPEIQYSRDTWENLSKQTMSEIQYKEATWETETPTQKYIKNIKKLSSKTIKYDYESKKEFKLKEDLIKELKYMSVEEGAELLSQYDSYSLKELLKTADRTLKNMEKWKKTKIWKDQLSKLLQQINDGNDLRNKMIDENKQLRKQVKEEEAGWLEEYKLISWITDHEQAKSQFVKTNTLYWKHLVWLKDVNIKKLEWKITDGVAHKFSLIVAKASQILWIDFNKVIWDNKLNLTLWTKDNVYWYFVREWTKEMMIEYFDKVEKEWGKVDRSWIEALADNTFKAWVYLATLDISIDQSAATLVHEFMHMVDYKRAVDLWLPIKNNEHYRINENQEWRNNYDTEYVLEWEEMWKTFNNPEDIEPLYKPYRKRYDDLMSGKIKPWDLNATEADYVNNMLYLYSPTEILARYWEQYYMYKENMAMFDEFSKKAWYWSKEEFLKLLDTFEESILKDEFADYQIDEWNRNYYDLMVKLDDFKYKWTLVQDKKWLENIKENNPEFNDEARMKMLEMQKEYVTLAAELDKLEWTINDEIRAEYATELDNLATNMWILEQVSTDYMNFIHKKVPVSNFEAADTVLENENLEEDKQQIEDEDISFEEQKDMQDEMDDKIDAAGWIQNVETWDDEAPEWFKEEKTLAEKKEEYEKETKTQKQQQIKRNLVESRDWIWDVAKDILTPTMSRIYNIDRRVAWRLTQMETQTWINIYRYTQKCQWFVDHMQTLKWEAKLEVTEALLNFWALASEQSSEDIASYKENERNKLRDVLLKHWFKEQDINNMFSVLNDLWTRYQEAWLSISLSDMYFPRVVKDYKWLIEYMSKVSGEKIEDKTRDKLMKDIQDIIDNPSYSDEEKEKLIRNKLTVQFPRRIKVNSKHSEQRKLWLLSDWWAGIYAYYEDPTVSLAHYITTMEYAIQRQLFLWWQAKDLWLDIDTISSSNEESVSSIVRWLVERWDITEKQVNELQKCIIAVMDKKHTPRWIQRIKDLTYVMALTNYISAVNQMEDIWVAIVENKWWLISAVKSIFTKAWIKYEDSWLESAYEMFKTDVWISNKLFAASLFNFTDRLGKKCFLNAAWTSMVKKSKNERSRWYLYDRLKAMYWEETANHIMDKVDSWDYMTDWQIDIDVLTDLLYQLGTTQPIYASAMPVAYLRSPWARWFYALSMFAIRQADHIIQSTKQTYQEKGVTAAAVQAFWYISTRMFFGALVWDIWDWLQWKGEEETWLWQWINEWIDAAWQKFLEDYLKAFSKLWMLSDYDKDTWKKEWIWWVIANKMYPYIIQEWYKWRKSIERAFKNEDRTELVPMLRDVPLIWKQAVGWWNYFVDEATSEWRPTSKSSWRPTSSWSERPSASNTSRPSSK